MLSDLRYRLRALFRRHVVERELDEELAFHLAQAIAQHCAEGMTEAEATRRARLAFGGVARIKDDARDARGLRWLERRIQDVRYAVRRIRRRPGFAVAVILTLGLGLGANVAMFGIVDRLLFRPPGFLRSPAFVHRVYLIQHGDDLDQPESHMSYTRYRDLRRWSTALEQTAAFQSSTLAVGSGEDTREMEVGIASASYFAFFDVQPVIGRFFTEHEDSIGASAPVVVIGSAFWQAHYGGRRDILGTVLKVGALSCTIIGVAPPGFAGIDAGRPAALFIPITSYASTVGLFKNPSDYYTKYNWQWMEMLARRKSGVSVDATGRDLTEAFQRSYAAEATTRTVSPASAARPRALAGPIQVDRGPRTSGVARVALWVGGVAVAVLLIACANVANLFLLRAMQGRREIALRLALGVSRGRLFAQVLTESLVFAGLGALASVVIAAGADTVLRVLFLPDVAINVWGDTRTLIFAAVGAIAAASLTGIGPALHAGRSNLAATMQDGARDTRRHHSRLRVALLLFQGVLSVVLLVGAGLFVRSLHHVRTLRLGYDVDQLLYISPVWRGTTPTAPERIQLAQRMLDEVRSMPGIAHAALGFSVPFWTTWTLDLFRPNGDSIPRAGRFTIQAASSEYFETVGTRVVRGRGFTDADREGALRVMLVSEPMARTLWPDRDAIGQCLKVDADTMPCTTVVGITDGIKQSSLTDDPGLQYYLPIRQWNPEEARLFVRTRQDARVIAESTRRRLQRLMPGAAYVTVMPMRTIIGPEQQSWRLGATMFVAFGALALALAAIGLYSVIAYSVAQRTRELGVRVALGAGSANILWLVLADGVRFAIAGIVLGGIVAVALARWVAPLLFQEPPTDPLVFGAAMGILLTAAVAASVIPALRATRVAPNVALRAD